MKVSTDSLSVLACQIDIPESLTASARDQHLKSLHEKIAKTLDDSPANLIVLPELSSIDYSRESFERLDVLGEDLDGASVETWRKLARNYNCHVAFSFPRRAADSTYRITLAVVNPDGELIGHYDKIYLAQFGASMEKDYFVPGDTPLVFAIGSFVIAPIICADIRFPEFCRSLTVDHDVDAILHCGAYYRDESFYSWHSFAETRALENQVYFLSVNRAGAQYGESIIFPPWVDNLHRPHKLHTHDEHLLHVTLHKPVIDDARRQYPFLQDRRTHR